MNAFSAHWFDGLTSRMHAVGLVHKALPGSLGKAFGNHGTTHHRHYALKQVGRHGFGQLRQIALAAMQNAVFKRVDAVAVFGHGGIVGNHNHGNTARMAERAKIIHDQAAGLGIQVLTEDEWIALVGG